MTMLTSDYIRDLVVGFTTNEWVGSEDNRRLHTVRHKALLDQLRTTLTGSQVGDDTVRRFNPGSKPAGRVEAMDLLLRIDRQSSGLACSYGLDSRLCMEDRLLSLSGVMSDEKFPDPLVKSWWAAARVLTRLDAPAYAPHVPCPNEECDTLGSLRVRVEERPEERVAVCTECHMVWAGTADFGMLARWVEWASEHMQGARHWVNDSEVHGYPRELGYLVECEECLPWRKATVSRVAERRERRAEERMRRAG